MTPAQIRALVEAFGLSCDGLHKCTIEITRSQVTATCVYWRSEAAAITTAADVVRRFNLRADHIGGTVVDTQEQA